MANVLPYRRVRQTARQAVLAPAMRPMHGPDPAGQRPLEKGTWVAVQRRVQHIGPAVTRRLSDEALFLARCLLAVAAHRLARERRQIRSRAGRFAGEKDQE